MGYATSNGGNLKSVSRDCIEQSLQAIGKRLPELTPEDIQWGAKRGYTELQTQCRKMFRLLFIPRIEQFSREQNELVIKDVQIFGKSMGQLMNEFPEVSEGCLADFALMIGAHTRLAGLRAATSEKFLPSEVLRKLIRLLK